MKTTKSDYSIIYSPEESIYYFPIVIVVYFLMYEYNCLIMQISLAQLDCQIFMFFAVETTPFECYNMKLFFNVTNS